MNITTLAPKMAAHYAALAKAGKADESIGDQHYVFYIGSQKITLVSVDPPIGHVQPRPKDKRT